MQGEWVLSLVGEIRSHMPKTQMRLTICQLYLNQIVGEKSVKHLKKIFFFKFLKRICLSDIFLSGKGIKVYSPLVLFLQILFIYLWLCWVFVAGRAFL